MVLYSQDDSKWDLKEKRPGVPFLLDRLAATLIDLLIMLLFSSLILAPFRKDIFITRLLGSSSEYAWKNFLLLILFLLLTTLYQTLWVYFKGTTPGKKVFRIYVFDLWGQEKPDFFSCLTRGFLWSFSWLLLGIPFIGVLTNRHRRPLHDLIAETCTLSSMRIERLSPSRFGSLALSAFISGSLLFVFGFIIYQFGFGEERLNETMMWRNQLKSLTVESCEQVDEAYMHWPHSHTTELKVAMALYSAGIIEKECLGIEAFKAFRNQKDIELAYLAKSFYHSDDADLSDEYLDKVCAQNNKTEACQLSRLITLWTDKNWSEAEAIFEDLLADSSEFTKIWAIKHFERTKNFSKELELIDKLWPNPFLESFLSSRRAMAFWGLNRRNEARAILAPTLNLMSEGEKSTLSTWFCYRELVDSCEDVSVNSHACRVFDEFVKKSEEALSYSSQIVTFIRYKECSSHSLSSNWLEGSIAQLEFSQMIGTSVGLEYMIKLLDISKKNNHEAILQLQVMLEDSKWDKVYTADIKRRIVALATDASHINPVRQVWLKSDSSSWEYRELGELMLKKFMNLGLFKHSLEIGQALLQSNPSNLDYQKHVITSAFKMGNKSLARSILNMNTRKRSIASEDEYEKIKVELEGR